MESSVLAPASVEVAFRGETLTISPIKIGQIPGVLKCVRPILGAISKLSSSPVEGGGGVEIDLLQLVEENGETLIEACAIATGQKIDYIAGADVDEFVQLAKAVIEVNSDFFAKRVAPLLGDLPAVSGGGKTPSNT